MFYIHGCWNVHLTFSRSRLRNGFCFAYLFTNIQTTGIETDQGIQWLDEAIMSKVANADLSTLLL